MHLIDCSCLKMYSFGFYHGIFFLGWGNLLDRNEVFPVVSSCFGDGRSGRSVYCTDRNWSSSSSSSSIKRRGNLPLYLVYVSLLLQHQSVSQFSFVVLFIVL